MDGSFERSLYLVHERLLLVFSDVEAPDTPRACDPKRCCRNLELTLLAALACAASVLVAVHSAHVGSAGCFGAVANAAARAWGAPNATTAAAFFQPSDVFHVELLPGAAGWGDARASLWDPGSAGAAPVNYTWDPGAGPAAALPLALRNLSASSAPMGRSRWDYVFSAVGGPALVYLETAGAAGYGARASQGLRRVELSLPLRCAGGGGPSGATQWLFAAGLASFDTVMVNELSHTFAARGGFVASMATGEVWNWGPLAEDVTSASPLGARRGAPAAAAALDFRASYLLAALFNFFMLSSLCAILLRVLLTSGVALVYPWARCLVVACVARVASGPERAMRSEAAVREVDRTLNAAYPWLGAHVAFARRYAMLFAREGAEQGLVEGGANAGAGAQGEGGGGGGGGGAQPPQPQQQQQAQQHEGGGLLAGAGGGGQVDAGAVLPAAAGGAPAGADAAPPLAPPPPLPLQQQQGSGEAWSFLWAHVQCALVLFLAAQLSANTLTVASLLGWKSSPQGLSTSIWFVFFLGEVCALFSLRTQASIVLFPRACLALYLCFCLYHVKTPYGFYDEALAVWTLAVLCVYSRLLRWAEVPALREGAIHMHRPRALLARLPAPQPFAPASGILPSLYTVFLPLNTFLPLPPPLPQGAEGQGAYAIPVPPRDGAAGAEAEA